MASFLQNKTLLSDEKFTDSKMLNLYEFSLFGFGRYIISYHCKGNLFLNLNHGTFQLTRLDSLLLIKHESVHVTFVLDTCIK